MDLMTLLVIVAMVATLGALVAGLSAMATGSEVGHRASIEWMAWRVGLQGLAFLLVLLAIFALN